MACVGNGGNANTVTVKSADGAQVGPEQVHEKKTTYLC